MGERTARPPRREGSNAPGATFRLAGPVARRDVRRTADEASRVLADRWPGTFACDVGAADPATLPTVDVLARLALAARRCRRELRLEHASPDILALLELCGLGEVVRCADEASTAGIPGAARGSGREVVR